MNLESAQNAQSAEGLSSGIPAVSEEKMDLIPEAVYSNMPEILSKECKRFEGTDRDIFFLSMISLISGITKNYSSVYADQAVYPNLYFMLIANPASGKGKMLLAKDALAKVDAHIKRNTKGTEVKTGFGNTLKESRSAKLFIPGNSSASALLGTLESSNGSGIIFETEADTLSASLKQDWGGFSDLLRKAFHHEPLSDNKNSGNMFIEINEPKLSVVLSGTPNQVPSLINSVGDGLFSRFMMYNINTRAEWKDVFKRNFKVNHFKEVFAQEIFDYYTYYNSLKSEISFELSELQSKEFNKRFKEQTKKLQAILPAEHDATVFRLGLICYRLMMCLSALRYFESKSDENIIRCSDADFETVFQILPILINHNFSIFKMIPKSNYSMSGVKNVSTEAKLLSLLPKQIELKTSEILEIGTKLGLHERQVKNLIDQLHNRSAISKVKHGVYKVEVN